MKKLMVAAVAIAVAVVANAASVSWSSGSSYLVDPSTGLKKTSLDSGSIWLAVLGDTTGWSAGTWAGTSENVVELQQGTIVSSGKAAAQGKVSMEYKFTYGEQPFADDSVLAVVFKDDNGKYSQLKYYDSTAAGGIGAAVTDTLTVSGLADAEALYSGSLTFATGGNFTTVPEPTSGLLLLLGMAGLALKRKRA